MLRWGAQWLERRGLGDVADTLDAPVADAGNSEALHAMAKRALERGDAEGALKLLAQALDLAPLEARLWCTRGAAYRRRDAFDEARDAYEQALRLKPDFIQAMSNLGEWCMAKGKIEEALDWYDRALAVSPAFFEGRLNRVAALFEAGRYDEARTAAEALVSDAPERPEAYLNLGNILVHTGKAKQGLKQYHKALELRPGYAEAHFNLAGLLGTREDLARVIGYLEQQIKDKGESVHLQGLLAAARQAAGELSESATLCRRILEKHPEHIGALVTLASCLSSGGDAAAAYQLYERVVALDASQSGMASNLLFEGNNLGEVSREVLFSHHLDWARRFEAPLAKPADFSQRNADPGRKIRVGYVSGDFVVHPVGFLLRDILKYHDREGFEIYGYSMVVRSEEVLPELKNAADAWEEVFFHSDDEFVELVRRDEIDILVDLSGHTAYNRLVAMARRPAPIQVEWIGYFHSTGMSSIDYFITDPYTSPAGSGQLFTEIPLHLPHTRFCYGPPEYAPDVAAPPVLKKDHITFGSFNRLPKITDQVLDAWSRVLKGVPHSRMIVKSGALADEEVKNRLVERFLSRGIGADRLDIRENSAHQAMLAEYGDVDIALDTFPFNGGMTTLEALWMGVPVVTIAGNTVVSRQTVAALANIGLDRELAFADVDAFVAGAIALAQDRDRLAELRSQIRPRMKASPLRQSEAFAGHLEALYRRMWQAWCRGEKVPSDV